MLTGGQTVGVAPVEDNDAAPAATAPAATAPTATAPTAAAADPLLPYPLVLLAGVIAAVESFPAAILTMKRKWVEIGESAREYTDVRRWPVSQ